MGSERLWTLLETAAYLGVPGSTLYQWISRGTAPKSYRIGRYRRFDPVDVQKWLDQHASKGPAA
jgi:DNA binding domain, excisionase family